MGSRKARRGGQGQDRWHDPQCQGEQVRSKEVGGDEGGTRGHRVGCRPSLGPMRMGKGRDELRSVALLPCQAQSSVGINPDMVICPHLSVNGASIQPRLFDSKALSVSSSKPWRSSHNKGAGTAPQRKQVEKIG